MSLLPRLTIPHLLVGLAGVALLASGCSGGGNKVGSPTTLPVATSVPPPGRVQLAMIVVQPSDLPTGWTATPAKPAPNPEAEPKAFAQCMGTTSSAADLVAIAYSPDYVHGTQVVSSSATSFRTRADVPADTATLTSAKAASCLEEVDKARLGAELPAGGVVKSYSVKVTPGTGGGAANIVAIATATATYSENGHSLTLNDETVYLVAPRIEARIDFSSVGTTVSDATRLAVENQVAQRVAFGS